MGSVVIVVAPPCVDDEFGVAKAVEEMLVETFVTQSAIEAFNKAVLHRLTRCDEVPGHTALLAPFEHDVRGKLRAVVRDDHAGRASELDDLVELTRHSRARD